MFVGMQFTSVEVQRQASHHNGMLNPKIQRTDQHPQKPQSYGRLCAKRENKSAEHELPMQEFTYKTCRTPNLQDTWI